MEAAQCRLGLVGYGEIGSTLGSGLRRSGLMAITAYDRYAFDGPYAALIQRRAEQAGVVLVRSAAELAAGADVILGVTPGSASVESAGGFVPHLGPRHIFVDAASATPGIKREVAARLGGSGAAVGDASIVGTPRDGHAMPMLASGPAAEAVRDALVPWGMRIDAVGPDVGTASGIKILRSVVMKGFEALLVECLLGARRYGVEKAILASLEASFRRPFPDMVDALLTTGVLHAERRSEEAAMAAEALAEAGIEPVMARATAERLRWVADLGLKEHFGGEPPAHHRDALAAIEAKAALS